jgi:hypothetical protein
MRSGNLCDPTKKMPHVVTGKETKGCGCMIPMKVLAPTTLCPLGKWKDYDKGRI